MPEVVISDGRYMYCHMEIIDPTQTVDVHNIFFAKSKAGVFILCLCILLLITSFCILLFTKEQLNTSILWVCLVGTIPIVLLKGTQIKKESVVILPTLGVQLEAHYWSGKVRRRFVSTGKILKPVLNECVTPVTCYWSLALVLRDENELMLVFENTRIPVKMLIPVWRALCAVTESKNDK